MAKETTLDLRGSYEAWIRSASRKEVPISLQYKEALNKYSARHVTEEMQKLMNRVDQDLTRKAFVLLSSSAECFVTLRQNFVTSYATMCVAHWVLGIGDRHLENTLVKVKSGRCVGIDFGLAFGGGVDQSVPELMPFRLTPQILGLLKPFTERDFLGSTMTHVLRALRRDSGPLLATLDIFIHEPLNWADHVNKLAEKNEEAGMGNNLKLTVDDPDFS